MKLIFTSSTSHSWEGFVGGMKHGITDETRFDSFKVFIHAILPQKHRIDELNILSCHHGDHGQDPSAPLRFRDAHALRGLDLDGLERVVQGDLEDNRERHLVVHIQCLGFVVGERSRDRERGFGRELIIADRLHLQLPQQRRIPLRHQVLHSLLQVAIGQVGHP